MGVDRCGGTGRARRTGASETGETSSGLACGGLRSGEVGALVGERGGVWSAVVPLQLRAIGSKSTAFASSLLPPVGDGIVRAAATCSRSFCLTRVRLFSASSSLDNQSSIDESSSESASSCLRIASCEKRATRGDRKYVQMRS